MNPNNYKEDGSVKKGKKTWKKSKTYQAVQNRLKSLRRQKAARLKQWQEAEVNKITAMGNKVFVETMDFKALQKRAKNTERQERNTTMWMTPYEKKKLSKRYNTIDGRWVQLQTSKRTRKKFHPVSELIKNGRPLRQP